MNLLDHIRQRHSCRSYREEPVAREHIESLLEAARLAPSACNQQPWRFAIVTDNALRQRLVKEGFLPGIRMQWALKAPVHIVLGIKRGVVTHRIAPLFSRVDYPLIDAGIAGEHLVLAATELGLGTCWIGWLRPERVRRIVGWPLDTKPITIITVGHPDVTNAKQRPRKTLEEIATWVESS